MSWPRAAVLLSTGAPGAVATGVTTGIRWNPPTAKTSSANSAAPIAPPTGA